MSLLANPEFVRHLRAQLRWDRMLIIAVICAVLSLVVGFSMAYNARDANHPGRWGADFLRLVVYVQTLVLLLIGGLASAHAIQREKDRNTFDFQRVTRLAPLELTLGKLFGAPVQAYFIALCLVPAALVGAIVGGAHLSFVLAAYVILALGAITFHAFTLLISLLVERDAAATVAVLGILILGGLPTSGSPLLLRLGTLSPFFAGELVGQTTWALDPGAVLPVPRRFPGVDMTDVLFGWPVHHVPVLAILYLIFTGWFLLVVARNIRRDPAVYEIFTPGQALGFAFYVNLILIGFFRWPHDAGFSSLPPMAAQGVLLGINTALFFALGLALLRNRDHVRRLRELRARGMGWVAAIWPAPYVIAGVLLAGLAQVAILQARVSPGDSWDPGLAVFRVALFAMWVARDILYFQWMNLRRGGRALLLGFIYLIVFYTCATLVLGTLHLFTAERGLAVTVAFVPGAVFDLDSASWAGDTATWLGVLLIQVLAAGVFVYLQRRALGQLTPPTAREPAAAT